MQLPNLLELALGLLPPVEFKHRYFVGETRNEIGVKIPSYSEWSTCVGMVQPVQRSRYQDLGLDFAKNYINVWGSIELHTVGLQNQPDQIFWSGKLWSVTTVNDWPYYNGWVNVTAAQDKRFGGIDIPGGGELLVEDPKTIPDPEPTVNSLHEWASVLNKKIKG